MEKISFALIVPKKNWWQPVHQDRHRHSYNLKKLYLFFKNNYTTYLLLYTNVNKKRIFFCFLLLKYVPTTGNMRQLVVDRRICCCSQFMIFLLELLGQAIGCLAGPSSSNRKIMNWEQQQILLSTTNCLILAVLEEYLSSKKLHGFFAILFYILLFIL